MRKILPYFFTLVMVVLFAITPFFVHALSTQDILISPQTNDALTKLSKPANTYSPADTVSKVLTLIFSFIAILAVSLIMYGGFLWVTSGGESEKAKKAQGLLVDAAIGLVVLGAVWMLAYFIIKTLAEQVIPR